jgi:metaxin
MSLTSLTTLPAPLRAFFAHFPLKSFPAITVPRKYKLTGPTLWIRPPRTPEDVLSSDVECLKWQAYLAFRGLTGVAVRSDISPEGALDARLPNLQVPLPGDDAGYLLAPYMIPGWVDSQADGPIDALEGYMNEGAKDESHAWISLLEGNVHAALILSQPGPSPIHAILAHENKPAQAIETVLTPPPAPLFGFSSLLPAYGARVSTSAVEAQYREAISALSERLGTDNWFLGSSGPTPLDALVFAYLHTLLHSSDPLRIEVTRRVNLVAWEWRVRSVVRAAFQLPLKEQQ